jgi:hypothetical protein
MRLASRGLAIPVLFVPTLKISFIVHIISGNYLPAIHFVML